MLPAYVSYFAGGGKNGKGMALRNAFGFVSGFTLMFVLMGALAGTAGSFLARYRAAVNVVAGLFVIFFGLSFLGVFELPFSHKGEGAAPKNNLGFWSSVLFGVVFSTGHIPCIAAVLGSALMLASSVGGAFEGIVMLFVYSLGLGVPLVLSAVLIDRLKNTLAFIKRNYGIINKISGGILVSIGALMATGLIDRMIEFIELIE